MGGGDYEGMGSLVECYIERSQSQLKGDYPADWSILKGEKN